MQYPVDMPSIIRVLDEKTINQIAAGEVVENPASVVKELVENAMDADATEICVEIKGGGRQLIRVTDNGHGMTEDDALLSLERHATSKIRELDDIHAISTMGFRGEAVPSIASISKFTLLTCHKDNPEKGTMVIVDGGNILNSAPAARSPGTTIEVKSLFFNVPVRKKFQRSPTYDTNEILKVLTLQALAHPQIKFEMISNQAVLLSTHLPQGNTFEEQLGERISEVMGKDFFSALCPIDCSEGDYHLCGFIGVPTYTRHNRTGQHLFINGRVVFSPLVSFAVREGYGTAMSTNRHPVFVLHLTMPGNLVDVNVHPQKREVRLRQSHVLKELIMRGVERAFQQPERHIVEEAPRFVPPAFHPPPETFQIPVFKQPYVSEAQEPMQTVIPDPKPIPPRVIATIKGYIIIDMTDKDGLCLIDQKSAHSRIVFERLLKKSNRQQVTEMLLIPYNLDVSSIEAALLRESLENLNDMGIQIEEFGPNSFIVHSLPSVFGNTDVAVLVNDLLHSLREFDGKDAVNKEKEKRIALAASRASVSQKSKLTLEEAQALLNQLMDCESPYQCPYGKSTFLYLSLEELDNLRDKICRTKNV